MANDQKEKREKFKFREMCIPAEVQCRESR